MEIASAKSCPSGLECASRMSAAPILEQLFPIVIDNDLQLRLLEMEDASRLYQLVDSSRSRLRKWLPFVDEYRSVDNATQFISKCRQQLDDRSGLGLGIWSMSVLAGVVTYDYIDWKNGATRIGYWLGNTFESRGLMTRTCQALVEFAFHKLRLNRVEIWCASANERCRRIPEKLSFKLEGILRERERISDQAMDIVSYAMLAREWKRSTLHGQTRI